MTCPACGTTSRHHSGTKTTAYAAHAVVRCFFKDKSSDDIVDHMIMQL